MPEYNVLRCDLKFACTTRNAETQASTDWHDIVLTPIAHFPARTVEAALAIAKALGHRYPIIEPRKEKPHAS